MSSQNEVKKPHFAVMRCYQGRPFEKPSTSFSHSFLENFKTLPV